jgi:hypothetical protein
MTDDDQDQAQDQSVSGTPAPTADAFLQVFALIDLVRNEAAFHRKLRGLAKALESANAAQKQLVVAASEFEAYQTKTRAELDERETAVRAREVAAYTSELELKERAASLPARYREVSRQEARLKEHLILLAGLDAPGPLQSEPSWYRIGEALMAEHPRPEPEFETVTVRPADAPEGSTLTQTFHRPYKRSARRAEAS